MQTFLRAAAILGVITFTGLAAASTPVDLTGWWRVIQDDGHIIKIVQLGSDVTILDSDGTLIASGVFANDTLSVYLSSGDTVVLVYHADTLSGMNEEGNPLTIVKYRVDLNGWWRNLDGGREIPRFVHQGSDVQLWMETDTSAWFVANGTFADDTLLLDLGPELGGELMLIYAFDTLRGFGGPDEDSIILVRAPYGLRIPIRCGTIEVDGQTDDWSDAHPAIDDANDDGTSTPAAELDRFYLCYDSAYLYFRIDCVGEVVFPHSGDYNDRYTILFGPSGTDYEVRIQAQGAEMLFRNSATGVETWLELPGVEGHTIEGRTPLYLLDGPLGEIGVFVSSSRYGSDIGEYDQIETNAEIQNCDAEVSVLAPEPQYLLWVYAVTPVIDTLVIGNLPDRAASEIQPSSVLINGAIQPAFAAMQLEYPGFAGGVFKVLFPARVFLLGYGPVWDTTVAEYTVTGTFSDGEALNFTGEVSIIGHRSGDVDGDGSVNVGDATYLMAYVFRGGRAPQPSELGDIDCSGAVNILDITGLVAYLVRNGPPPCGR